MENNLRNHPTPETHVEWVKGDRPHDRTARMHAVAVPALVVSLSSSPDENKSFTVSKFWNDRLFVPLCGVQMRPAKVTYDVEDCETCKRMCERLALAYGLDRLH